MLPNGSRGWERREGDSGRVGVIGDGCGACFFGCGTDLSHRSRSLGNLCKSIHRLQHPRAHKGASRLECASRLMSSWCAGTLAAGSHAGQSCEQQAARFVFKRRCLYSLTTRLLGEAILGTLRIRSSRHQPSGSIRNQERLGLGFQNCSVTQTTPLHPASTFAALKWTLITIEGGCGREERWKREEVGSK